MNIQRSLCLKGRVLSNLVVYFCGFHSSVAERSSAVTQAETLKTCRVEQQ